MSEFKSIPDEFQGSIKRLLNKVAPEQRNDEALHAALLVYVKLGGEKLARHYIETSKKVFPEQLILIKRQFRDGVDDDEDADLDQPEDAERDGEFAADVNKMDANAEDFA